MRSRTPLVIPCASDLLSFTCVALAEGPGSIHLRTLDPGRSWQASVTGPKGQLPRTARLW